MDASVKDFRATQIFSWTGCFPDVVVVDVVDVDVITFIAVLIFYCYAALPAE